MKKAVALFFTCVCLYLPAFGFKIRTGFVRQEKRIVKEIKFFCLSQESADCLYLCNSPLQCSKIEPYCLNCAGTSSVLLRQLFTQISTYYKPTDKVYDRSNLFNYLLNKRYVLFGADSVFNYYKSPEGFSFKKELEKYCPLNNEEPQLVVELNEEHQPKELSFIVCQDDINTSRILEVELRHPEKGIQQISVELIFD